MHEMGSAVSGLNAGFIRMNVLKVEQTLNTETACDKDVSHHESHVKSVHVAFLSRR